MTNPRNLLQESLAAIERLQARLDASERVRKSPIAIIGAGCRYPGGIEAPEDLWRVVSEGIDAVSGIPAGRWDADAYYDPDPKAPGKMITRRGGFLDQVDRFDPQFFGISPREAVTMDPQQRLLLECATEALESAGLASDKLAGSATGVFVGITTSDYGTLLRAGGPENSDVYSATGSALNVAAGRISFLFGFQGPSVSMDTACSSSLVAVHMACQSLRTGESDLALAGGVNVVLSPDAMVLFSKWGMMAPDGACKTFDAAADGFVRAEGCAVIALKRLADAQAAGDPILAVIRGSAVNSDGRSSGLTVPNGPAQEAVIRKALDSAALSPADIDYVEAHGTGTPLGDPIEVEALGAVMREGRPAERPLAIGSIKTNLGHTEAASGLAGLLKVVMSLKHEAIPPHLHFRIPNPGIPWERLPLEVPTSLKPWPRGLRVRRAGVSSFGFSGTNAHVVLEEAPLPPAPPVAVGPFVVPLAARDDAALRALALAHADAVAADPALSPADVAATLALGRAAQPRRAALVAETRTELERELRALARGESAIPQGALRPGERPKIAFLFTGQGAQYVGMGRGLYESETVFRASIDRASAVLAPLLERPLTEVLFLGDGAQTLINETAYTQPALFALEVALAELWNSWGIVPSIVVGHSVGEYAAACVAGVFSFEEGLALIAERGRLMQALPAGGAMAAIFADEARVASMIKGMERRLAIAALNAPEETVVSGDADALAEVLERATRDGVESKALEVSHAFHSPRLDPMLDALETRAATVTHAAPRISLISNVSGALFATGSRPDARYWRRHAREPVRFTACIEALKAAGATVAVEIGPHPTLLSLSTRAAPDAPWTCLASMRRGRDDAREMRSAAAALWVRGAPIQWPVLTCARGGRRVALPTYPFQRERYMIPFAVRSQRRQGHEVHPLLGTRLVMAGVDGLFERRIDATDPAWLRDHRIGSDVVMPMTAYLEVCLAALWHTEGRSVGAIDGLEIGEPMVLRAGEARLMQVIVDRADSVGPARIRIFSRGAVNDDAPWLLHASASASAGVVPADEPSAAADLAARAAALPRSVEVGTFYDRLRDIGVDFGPSFRSMTHVRVAVGEALGEIEPDKGRLPDIDEFLMHPALLDACLHVSAVAMDSLPGMNDGRMYLPIGVERYQWWARPCGPMRSHATVRSPAARDDMLLIDVRIETLDAQPVAALVGLRCRRASRDMFRRRVDSQVGDWLYELAWSPLPSAAATHSEPAGTWLILDDGSGRGERLADEIARGGGETLRVVPQDAPLDGAVGIDPTRPEAYAGLLASAAKAGGLAGVVSLWPLRLPKLGTDSLPGGIQELGTEAALHLLQALAGAPLPRPPRLWFVTAGSQVVDGTETPRIEQAPVAGFARVAATEHPELRVTLVDLDAQDHAADAKALADELCSDTVETQLAWRKGKRYVARLARRSSSHRAHVDDAPLRLGIAERGTLENLAFEPMQRRAPGPGEVELRVRASGLNFRDVLSVLGLYPGELRHLGSDCAGEITAVGEGVTQFAVGDRVVAMAEGAFASHAVTRRDFVAPLPHGLDFEQGAAIPTAYLTAEITLNLIGGIKRGDTVLIHSGAGGVGMAAIALARRVGAIVFATAGSAEKRAVLARMGVAHVLDSRSASFGDEVMRITGGRGVDMVLNSLTGALLDKSFECLADGGVFLEIGKRDLWTYERVAALNRGIRYHIVDCNDNARDTPQLVGEIFTRVLKDIESGALPQLPCTTFAFEHAADAFRHMAQARHIGRVVFRHRVEPRRLDAPIRSDATYLVTGGLTGLGLLAAQWLADQGARHLLLIGRRAPDATTASALAAIESTGVRVIVKSADMASDEGVASLMHALGDGLPALGGVLHCAAALDDGMLVNQNTARLARVMGPKADGAWRLHAGIESRGLRPDFFVLYSSLSAMFGAAGQGNYVAANAFLDALAHYRRALGLPATSINWGAWSEVGMATRSNTVSRAGAQGLASLGPADGIAALDFVLRNNPTQVAVAPIDWPVLAAQLGRASVPPLLRDLVANARSESDRGRNTLTAREQRIDFAALDAVQRLPQLTALVRRELATVLGLSSSPDSIATDQPFPSLGIDSLTAVELRNRLQGALGRSVPPTAAFEWPTVAEMAHQLDALFGGAGGRTGDGEPGDDDREEMTL